MRWLAVVCLALVPPSATGCAGTECNFHSQCERLHYCMAGRCQQDCQRDFDCAAGEHCSVIGQCDPGPGDGGPVPADGGVVVGDSSTLPPRDSSTPPPRDSGTPPRDSGGPVGTGRYLDRCATGGDCASGRCVADVGGTNMCTRMCTVDGDCADEHVCGSGVCVRDDTGRACTTATPATCTKGLCVGPSGGTGMCTKPCTRGSDCPAGFACTAAGGMNVCMDIERPCTGPTECLSGLCLSVQGCTAPCRTAADCPTRFSFLPAYTCAVAFGSSGPICVPPGDIEGNDAIGALCPATGTNECRSGACDTLAPVAPMCTQACTAESGCGPGLGCFPQIDGSDLLFLCSRAGTRALGQSCTSGRECDSGLCDATDGVCTRLCMDTLCPTGMTCEPVPGFAVSLCRP